MQLLVLALMFLMMGKNADVKEIEPIIETLGGKEASEALKQAEELSGMLSAVQSLTAAVGANGRAPQNSVRPDINEDLNKEHACVQGFPLEPIANIADERITYCLSKYIALGE